jgi:hypothetical protein
MSHIEISVKKASMLLSCSERNILYFIKMKEFQTVKVGKVWFIHYPSFLEFASRKGFHIKENFLESSENSVFSDSDQNSDQGEVKPSLIEGFHFKNVNQKHKNLKNKLPLLKMYLLFRSYYYESVILPHNERASLLFRNAIEEIGSGFVSYEYQDKKNHYKRARSCLGAILAIFYLEELNEGKRSLRESLYNEIYIIENSLLPMLGGLIKKMVHTKQKE